MNDFNSIITANYSQPELDQAIRDAVNGATDDVLAAMPADAWR